jgi:hypothetical protein
MATRRIKLPPQGQVSRIRRSSLHKRPTPSNSLSLLSVGTFLAECHPFDLPLGFDADMAQNLFPGAAMTDGKASVPKKPSNAGVSKLRLWDASSRSASRRTQLNPLARTKTPKDFAPAGSVIAAQFH